MKGRTPNLIVYHDGKRKERVELKWFSSTNEELHKLMVNKGFVKKPDDDIARMKKENLAKQRSDQLKRQKEKHERRRRRQQKMNQDQKKRKKTRLEAQNVFESGNRALQKTQYRNEYSSSGDIVYKEKNSPSDSRPNALQKDQNGIERKNLENAKPFTGLITDDMDTLLQIYDEL